MFQEDLAAGQEYRRLRDILRGIDLPPGVVAWEFEVGDDSTGDPAAWIWLLVDEDLVRRKEVSKVTMAAQDKILDALRTAGIRRWPYVRARTEAEQKALSTVPE